MRDYFEHFQSRKFDEYGDEVIPLHRLTSSTKPTKKATENQNIELHLKPK